MTTRVPWPARLAPSVEADIDPDATVWSSSLDVTPIGAGLLITGTAARRHGGAMSPGPVLLRVVVGGFPASVTGAHAGVGATDRGMATLVGAPVTRGFRKLGATATAETRLPMVGQVQLAGLLDDVPIAPILSRAATEPLDQRNDLTEPYAPPVDMCAGFRRGGQLVTLMTRRGSGRLGTGPAAEPATLPAPPVRSARRERLVVVDERDHRTCVSLWFRDTVGEPWGASVVHEYRAEVELADDEIVQCRATPVVLPGPDCSPAAGSAERLVGVRVDDSPDLLVATAGPSTCPHLDDMLRPLARLIARSL